MTHAVVVGGSISGLIASRVLLDHFDQVTVLEKGQSVGAPQAGHAHVLQLRGQHILERLFPGLTDELIGYGATLLDLTADWRISGEQRVATGLRAITCSRRLLEDCIWYRVQGQSRLTWKQGVRVMGLLATDCQRRVIGVKTDEGSLLADLVVEASGRASRLPEWLSSLGYDRPEESIVNAFVGYASRWYQNSKNEPCQGVISMARPGISRRGGILYPIERNRCIITLSGAEKDHPPATEADFQAFAETIRDPSIAEFMQRNEPITPIELFRNTENRLVHYERLSAMPEGIVAIGDAVCMLNPVYGQGMTVAAMGAQLLDQSLRRRSFSNLAFQKKLAKQNRFPWLLATGADLKWPMAVGQRSEGKNGWLQAYFQKVDRARKEDPRINRVALQVGHMVKSPTWLFSPYIVWRSLTLSPVGHTLR